MITAAKNFFSKEEQQRIVDAIREAERNTSGEIRVHIENFCFGDALEKAKKVFRKLEMQNTKDRNQANANHGGPSKLRLWTQRPM